MTPTPPRRLLSGLAAFALACLASGAERKGEQPPAAPDPTPSIIDYASQAAPPAAPPAAAPLPRPTIAPGETPSILLYLPKPEDAGPAPDAAPPAPAMLAKADLIADPSLLLPAGALAYLEAPSVTALAAAWANTAPGKLLADERVERFLNVNPIGLDDLFRDLPDSVAPREKVEMIAAAAALARNLPAAGGPAAFAVYAEPGAEMAFAYLVDVGHDRSEAWDRIELFIDHLAGDHPEFDRESVRAGDFRDRFQSPRYAGARLETGFAGNFAFVATRFGLVSANDAAPRLASDAPMAALHRAAGRDAAGGDSGRPTLALLGFARPGGLQQAAFGVPAAQRPARTLATLFGGVGNPAATLLYALRIDADGRLKEDLICPARAEDGGAADLPAWLTAYGRPPADGWPTLLGLPRHPTPLFALAGQVDPAGTASFFRAAQVVEFACLGDTSATLQAIRATENLGDASTGQAAIAFLPTRGDRTPWVVSVALRDRDRALRSLGLQPKIADFGGISIHRFDRDSGAAAGAAAPAAAARRPTPPRGSAVAPEPEPAEFPVWAVAGGAGGAGDGRPCLVGASNLDLLQRWLDQLAVDRAAGYGNSPLAAFVAGAPGDATLLAWFDWPLWATTNYSDFGALLRRYYPRLSNASSLPPLTLFRRPGPTGWTARSGSEGVRVGVAGDIPTAPAIAMTVVVGSPAWIRDRGRTDMQAAAADLRQLWLQLQVYQNRQGHFPASLDDFAAALPSEMRNLLKSAAGAGREGDGPTYEYVAGLSASDEPSLPILYDRKPWHNEYANWFNAEGQPSATGPYQPFRLVLTLDGRVRPVDEESFQTRVLPSLPAVE